MCIYVKSRAGVMTQQVSLKKVKTRSKVSEHGGFGVGFRTALIVLGVRDETKRAFEDALTPGLCGCAWGVLFRTAEIGPEDLWGPDFNGEYKTNTIAYNSILLKQSPHPSISISISI